MLYIIKDFPFSIVDTCSHIITFIKKLVADLLVANGIKAIWNFAHTDLNLPKDVIVESVHLSDSLMKLSYNISQREGGQKK